MAPVKSGDTAKVHYTGTLDDGTVFDSSRERDPLEFQVGAGQLIEGFDQAVVGMTPGETKKVKIPAEKAYGPHRTEMVIDVDKKQFPEGLNPEVGQQLQTQDNQGQPLIVTVIDIEDDKVTLDANHPLAGKDLNFELELVEKS
ncbi:FKBP-type peptidyl-prolyl cis-trans isomerase 2 [Geoalkalibacter ferrihydriticus]|uniref:Peptidyl-prolyl cis-trans isomerase n=2 Tax=Geoalkalibacter ferrihydriticus TaxID=392333 RepID=A0A0C2HT99_9BACT|nr:peptidylprolyl isomerase [Geoalkalibacter ferrihydriticus]KIH78035.1 peptidylprolyl isomerase [Geoalkalibacter ferrihydriticus DSM 17813]SDM32123.1 FKBP-type peptidyl-prolyl cis-trans isomerase 2 [Geoalkalibacter ferrihydriticus]